jgi:hypothetical protein
MADAQMKFFGIRLPQQLAEKMDEVLRTEGLQITEYIRGLVRENLRERGLLAGESLVDSSQPEDPAAGEPSTSGVGA